VRREGALTELFYVAGLAHGILLQLLLQVGALLLQEVLHGVSRVGLLPGCLQWLQGGEVLLTGVFQVGDGELGQLILASKGDAPGL
jgi:hypothetical protein